MNTSVSPAIIYPTTPEDLIDGAMYIAHVEPVPHLELDRASTPFSTPAPMRRLPGQVYSFGGTKKGAVNVDFIARKVMQHNGKGLYGEIFLSKREWEFLIVLHNHEGEMVTHEVLLKAVSDRDPDDVADYHQVVRLWASRLRGKIGMDAVANVQGIGYRLEKGEGS